MPEEKIIDPAAPVNVNRVDNCFLLLGTIQGPIKTVKDAPNAFAIRKLWVSGERPVEVGNNGLINGGVTQYDDLCLVIDEPAQLPMLQEANVVRTLIPEVKIFVYANIGDTNANIMELHLTNANISDVVQNYRKNFDPNAYPNQHAVHQVLLKFSYAKLELVIHKYEDGGSATGNVVATIDLTNNTVKVG